MDSENLHITTTDFWQLAEIKMGQVVQSWVKILNLGLVQNLNSDMKA